MAARTSPPPSSPPPFDAVFFDLDGTLADSSRDIREALALAFEAIGVEPARDVEALVDGSPLEEIFAVAAPAAGAAELSRFVDAYRARYEAAGHRHTRLYPGVRPTLDALASLRPWIKLAIATTKREASARGLLDAMGIAHVFDLVGATGGTSIRPKPAPDLLLAVADALRVAPSRVLMVGDTLRDVVAGQRAGMRTAAVTYGLGAPDALVAARPDYVLEEMDELLVVLGVAA